MRKYILPMGSENPYAVGGIYGGVPQRLRRKSLSALSWCTCLDDELEDELWTLSTAVVVAFTMESGTGSQVLLDSSMNTLRSAVSTKSVGDARILSVP